MITLASNRSRPSKWMSEKELAFLEAMPCHAVQWRVERRDDPGGLCVRIVDPLGAEYRIWRVLRELREE